MSKTKSASDKYRDYLKTWAGQELLKKHSLSETGTWLIRGEDPNADFGGPHYGPELGIVEGTLKDVVEYAVTLSNFWPRGPAGSFEKMSAPVKITPGMTAERVALTSKIEKLEAELAEACAKLGAL